MRQALRGLVGAGRLPKREHVVGVPCGIVSAARSADCATLAGGRSGSARSTSERGVEEGREVLGREPGDAFKLRRRAVHGGERGAAPHRIVDAQRRRHLAKMSGASVSAARHREEPVEALARRSSGAGREDARDVPPPPGAARSPRSRRRPCASARRMSAADDRRRRPPPGGRQARSGRSAIGPCPHARTDGSTSAKECPRL